MGSVAGDMLPARSLATNLALYVAAWTLPRARSGAVKLTFQVPLALVPVARLAGLETTLPSGWVISACTDATPLSPGRLSVAVTVSENAPPVSTEVGVTNHVFRNGGLVSMGSAVRSSAWLP